MNRIKTTACLLGIASFTLLFAAAAWAEPPPDDPNNGPDRKPLEGPKRPPRDKVKHPDRQNPDDDAMDDDQPMDGQSPPPGDRDRRGPGRAPGDGRPMPPAGPDGGFGPRGGPHRGDGPGLRRLSSEQVDEILVMLRDNFPTLYERVRDIKSNRPESLERALRRYMPFVMQVLHSDPPMKKVLIADMKLELEVRDLVRKYHQSDSPQARQKLRGELRAKIDQQFDVRQEKHRLMIDGLERRLKEQKQLLDQRSGKKNELVDKRLAEITGPDDAMRFPE